MLPLLLLQLIWPFEGVDDGFELVPMSGTLIIYWFIRPG